jgi:hypothetical protein
VDVGNSLTLGADRRFELLKPLPAIVDFLSILECVAHLTHSVQNPTPFIPSLWLILLALLPLLLQVQKEMILVVSEINAAAVAADICLRINSFNK